MIVNSYNNAKIIGIIEMGKLIIDGNSFFEIDEECLKKRKISKCCGLEKYFKDKNMNEKYLNDKKENIKRGDG